MKKPRLAVAILPLAAALILIAACQSFPEAGPGNGGSAGKLDSGQAAARSASSKAARASNYAADAALLRNRPPPAATYSAGYRRNPGLPSQTEARDQAKRDFDGMVTPRVRAMLRLLNAERRKNGLSTVVLEPRLMAAALREAKDMAVHGHLSHTASDGSHMEDRIADVQYYYTKIAENIAATRATADETFHQWVISKDHYQQMMITGATQAGIAYAYNPNRPKGGARLVHYWVLLIGRPHAFYD